MGNQPMVRRADQHLRRLQHGCFSAKHEAKLQGQRLKRLAAMKKPRQPK